MPRKCKLTHKLHYVNEQGRADPVSFDTEKLVEYEWRVQRIEPQIGILRVGTQFIALTFALQLSIGTDSNR